MPTAFSLPDFVNRWRGSTLGERPGAQSHFIELCGLLDQPTPAAADQSGAFYTFEKGVGKSGGGDGFADVWLRGHFAWEYKGKRKNLDAAYDQLLRYKDDLENPPLLVVCDMNAFEVHTNFTNTPRTVHAFTLDDLLKPDPLPSTGSPGMSALEVLRAVFTDPGRLRPLRTTAQVTEDAAREFSKLADSLRLRGADPERAARFLMRLLFCLFAEDTRLLPAGLFTKLVEGTRTRPAEFGRRIGLLFAAMASGGSFGVEDIAHFDGGLFAGSGSETEALDLTAPDLDVLLRASKLDWASIEPAIFGTLFERSLDPAKRAQLGAHYTGRDDIQRIVEPVLMAPLRREWAAVQRQAGEIVAKRDAATGATRRRHEAALQKLLMDFSGRIAGVRVLDPACGSGNFLYVALKALMDLEKQVITFAATSGAQPFFYGVDPKQLYGIEVNPYAHELAQIVVWISYIQWLRDNGAGTPAEPILKPLRNIVQMDAILGRDAAGKPIEPEWPAADVIVGNPPFLGCKKLRGELGSDYVEALFALYKGRVPAFADLVCYWFERARAYIEAGATKRAGLLATNSIRGGDNRQVLDQIARTGRIFVAWSDRDWVLNGAAVRISMVGFDGGGDDELTLDGNPVAVINTDLTSSTNLTLAKRLPENFALAFIGDVKGGKFDITKDVAARFLSAPLNPNGRPNSEVILPWANGLDVTRRSRGMFIIDFGDAMSEEDASLYEAPFGLVATLVKPERATNNLPT